MSDMTYGRDENKDNNGHDEQAPGHDKHTPHPGEHCVPTVDTVSITKDGDTLTLTIDGVDSVIPGGDASASLDEDGTVRIYINASFKAHVVDLSAAAGS